MVYAIPALTTDTAIKLFGDFKVFTEAELVSRAEVKFENYAKTINIEAKTMIDMASKQIIPAVIKYATSWLDPSTPSPQQVLRQLVYRRIC